MRIIVLPVGRCRFLEENESGLRFRRDKICGLRNVRPLIIDPQLWVLLERHAIFAKLPCQNRQYNCEIYWTRFYQGNNFYNNYNKK